jgi:phytoene dehydrogenase-like protein
MSDRQRPTRPPRTATVVGSGPNGLAAAVVLAEAGLRVTVVEAADTVGGGTRSAGLLVPGVVHDLCSAAHPLAQASPFFHRYGDRLADHGLAFATAEVDMVHVLGAGRTASLHTDVSRTAAGFGDVRDARTWCARVDWSASRADDIAAEFLQPILHLPRHPLLFAGFGVNAALPATWSRRRFRTAEARALTAGIAAHAFTPLTHPGSSAAGALLTAAGHRYGWPVAVGGSQAIADSLVGLLESLGGSVVTGTPVTDLDEVADADVVLLDTSVETAASILGPRLPERVGRAWRRFRRGPAVAKVDYVLDGDVPWTAPDARRAGTVHLGGTAEQITAAEQDCWDGRLPARPFTLVCQQYLADPSRSTLVDGRRLNPLWAYAHVPAGWDGTPQQTFELVTTQIEDAAPGFREHIVDHVASPPTVVEAHNRNNAGGEISGGANDLMQLLARPRLSPDPYSTGIPGVSLCSSSTAPGGGVHFMCGMNAAVRALG